MMNRANPESGERSGITAVLFSGSAGSELATIRAAGQSGRLCLVSYGRKGLRGPSLTPGHTNDLVRFFGGDRGFDVQAVAIDPFCRILATDRFFSSLRSHGLLVLSSCGLCRLAFHWRALIVCLDNGIERLVDGTRHDHEMTLPGDTTVFFQQLVELYAAFGIELVDPVEEDAGGIEAALARLRYGTPVGNDWKKGCGQRCDLRILDAVFRRAVEPRIPGERFAKRTARFHKAKVALISDWTKEWLDRGNTSRLGKLLGK